MNPDCLNPIATAARQAGRFSALPRPFLRWAGSKQALLAQLSDVIPPKFGRYYEPFLGSGALFFHLKPKKATLSDASVDLISVWRAVRDNSIELNNYLSSLKPSKDLFYQIRNGRSGDGWGRAAEFIYLNKTCWNGLYRVNSKGEFNVPYGSPRSDFISDPANVDACSKLLNQRHVAIRQGDFERCASRAGAGDLVFFDPPYVTKHNYNGFRDWNEKLFSWADQERLARLANRLADRGVNVLVSNAEHEDILALYKNFSVRSVERASTLASDVKKRGRVTEALFYTN